MTSAPSPSPDASAKPRLHDWLMSDRPQSRRQASLGRAYGAWRTFSRNRLAMVGLFIVLALILVAIFANLLAPYSPYIGDLSNQRLLLKEICSFCSALNFTA